MLRNVDPFAPVDNVSLLEDKLQMSLTLRGTADLFVHRVPSTHVTHIAGMQIFVGRIDSFGLYLCVQPSRSNLTPTQLKHPNSGSKCHLKAFCMGALVNWHSEAASHCFTM